MKKGLASSYITGIHYKVAINLFTIGASTTVSLTSQENVTNIPFKPPLIALPNG